MATRAVWCRNIFQFICKRSYALCSVNSVLYHWNSSVNQPKLLHSWISSQCDQQLYCLAHKFQILYLYQSVRCYAKSRDKKKSDKGHKKTVHLNEELVAEVINMQSMRDQMKGSIEKLKEEYIKNLSLRSTSGSIETLPITFEGKDYILQNLAQVVRKNPKTVVINMGAFPQAIPTVIQAISKSGMNLNPQQDGTTLFIPIPKVTKEHRETLAKNAKALFIKCKDSLKDVQNKFIKTVKNKEKAGLAQDTAVQITEYIGFVATEYISEAEGIMEAKKQELLNET